MKETFCISPQNPHPLRSFFSPPFSVPLFVSCVVTSSAIRARSAHFVAHIWSQNCRSVVRNYRRRPWSFFPAELDAASECYMGAGWEMSEELREDICRFFWSVFCARRWKRARDDFKEEIEKVDVIGNICGMLTCRTAGRDSIFFFSPEKNAHAYDYLQTVMQK